MARAEIEIRPFVRDDWHAVCEVHERAARAELEISGTDRRAFRPMPAEEDLATFLQMNTAMVAVVEDEVVGFVAWRDRGEWVDSGYLSWLYVDPAHHRRGIGDRLLGTATESLGDQMWTLAKQGNEPAVNLYRAHGMRIVSSWPTDTRGHPYIEVRMALPTSRKNDPDVPNFGR